MHKLTCIGRLTPLLDEMLRGAGASMQSKLRAMLTPELIIIRLRRPARGQEHVARTTSCPPVRLACAPSAISGNRRCSGPWRLGSVVERHVSSRHAGLTDFRPNMCPKTPHYA